MKPAAVIKSAFVVSLTCTFKALLSFCIILMLAYDIKAQDTSNTIQPAGNYNHLRTGVSGIIDSSEFQSDPNHFLLTKKQINKRIRTIAIANIAGYGAATYGLNAAWYAGFPRSSFHTFNDNMEWQQVDKVGHMYSAYLESKLSMELWRWTGIGKNKRIWLGGLSGAVYQTVIEIQDGFSAEWGWSWGDFGANIIGSSTLIAQELAWNDQRIQIKFSFHKNNYGDAELNKRADELFGKTLGERFLKDYNAQTYWASANIKSFFPESKIPAWLQVAIGYGANGMFGATDNKWTDKNNLSHDRTDVKRYRQWFLAPDVDLSKIKTKKKGVKLLLTALSIFKFPTPSLEFSDGKLKVNALHF